MRHNRTVSHKLWPRVKTSFIVLIALVIASAVSATSQAKERTLLGYEEIIPQKTYGGKQFWGDQLFFHGWHIQQHAVMGHYRLLDASDKRYAWGTFDACKAKLNQIRRVQKLPPMKGKAVVLMHGLIRSHESMTLMADYLREKGGYAVFCVEYPSTQLAIEGNAKSLASVLESLDGIEEINFVGHSLGNIIVRRYLHDHLDPETGKPIDKRIRRMVMLGPPNHGSVLARALSDNTLFSANGLAGQELGVGWNVLSKKLATPPFEFAVIAGGRKDGEGYNPILRGDDDGTVRVGTTRLVGASDFMVAPVLHSFIMNDPTVQERTLQFLKKGYFTTEKERQPIK